MFFKNYTKNNIKTESTNICKVYVFKVRLIKLLSKVNVATKRKEIEKGTNILTLCI